jgi:Na+/H+ antiporter NhaA
MSISIITMCAVWCFIFLMVCQYKRVSNLLHLLDSLKEKKQFNEKITDLHKKQVFWSYVAIFPLLGYSIVSIQLFNLTGIIPPLLCYLFGLGMGKLLAKINFTWIKSSLIPRARY